jgi:hypothetical protein
MTVPTKVLDLSQYNFSQLYAREAPDGSWQIYRGEHLTNPDSPVTAEWIAGAFPSEGEAWHAVASWYAAYRAAKDAAAA